MWPTTREWIGSLFGIRNRSVDMRDIRHSRKKAYLEEGHGGKEIECWPIYRFFEMYGRGEPERARREFEAWYKDQYTRYKDVDKLLGGMRDGSLARTIARARSDSALYQSKDSGQGEAGDPVDDAIQTRVLERLALYDCIRTEGYRANRRDPVIGFEEEGCVFLLRGHHRVAILRSLGWERYPDVLTFSGALGFRLWGRWKRARALGKKLGMVGRGWKRW